MGRVEFDAVKAGSPRAESRVAELPYDDLDFRDREFTAFHPGQVVHYPGGRSHRCRAVKEGAQRFGARVRNLGDDAGAVEVDRFSEAFQSRYE